MKLRNLSKDLISRGIGSFAFCILLAFASTLTSASEPMTAEGRINRNAFPLAKFQDRYAAIPNEVEVSLRAKIEQVTTPIRLLPKGWFDSSFSVPTSPGDRRKILESTAETEIWKCLDHPCRGCPGSETLGCVISSRASTGAGVVAVIHPCLYGEVKCPQGYKPEIDVWVEKFVASIAYYKLGISNSTQPLKKAQEASSAWIHTTSTSVNETLGACPGPYSANTGRFLLKNDSTSEPNPAVKKCGEAYLRALSFFPERCSVINKSFKQEWKEFVAKRFKVAPTILRCDSFCKKMLCRTGRISTALAKVGAHETLFLFDGACEGSQAKDTESFIRSALPKGMSAPVEAAGCIQKGSVETKVEGLSGLGNGPEVQLIND